MWSQSRSPGSRCVRANTDNTRTTALVSMSTQFAAAAAMSGERSSAMQCDADDNADKLHPLHRKKNAGPDNDAPSLRYQCLLASRRIQEREGRYEFTNQMGEGSPHLISPFYTYISFTLSPLKKNTFVCSDKTTGRVLCLAPVFSCVFSVSRQPASVALQTR